jgi:hypothetical protein
VSGAGGKKGKKGSAIDDIFASTKKEKAMAAVKQQVRDVPPPPTSAPTHRTALTERRAEGLQEERREAEELEAMKSVHPAAFGACPPPSLTPSTATRRRLPVARSAPPSDVRPRAGAPVHGSQRI